MLAAKRTIRIKPLHRKNTGERRLYFAGSVKRFSFDVLLFHTGSFIPYIIPMAVAFTSQQ
jgi:hypothetical protein